MAAEKDDSSWLQRPLVPAIYIQTVLRLAEERGLDPRELLQEVGLSEADLLAPAAMVSPIVHTWLSSLVIERTGNHGLGFEIGLRLPPTAHGNLGYAMLCCGSLREVMVLTERFWHLRERGARIQFFEQNQLAVIEFHTELPFSHDLRAVFFDCLLAVVYRVTQLLLGDTNKLGELWLDYAEPDYYARYRDRLPPIRYGMPSIQARLPAEMLDRPLLMSNPEALKQAIAQCERENALLGNSGDDLLSRVREHMVLGEQGYPAPDVLAEKLHTSLRNLRRRLQAHGTGYKLLLEDARRRDALRFLDNPALEIRAVAELLGYLNPANFTRAFRQWTGKTPSEYRALRKPV